MDPISEILRDQDGTISRRQLRACDLGPAAIARLVRRREIARVHPGVYVDHTGPLTWHQRAWAAVLFSWPAALSHDSALRAAEGPGRRDRDDRLIHVAVDRDRRLIEPDGVRIHRIADLSPERGGTSDRHGSATSTRPSTWPRRPRPTWTPSPCWRARAARGVRPRTDS